MESTPQTAPAQRIEAGKGLSIGRYFTTAGTHPFDAVEWELREARIGHGDRIAFDQRHVELPKSRIICRGGAGSGINLSKVRGSMEALSRGGTASGPVSFMRGADSWAGSIKSGGGTRRAAKMVVLDVEHPDIKEFIWCKAKEEDKAAALRDAGFDMSIDGEGFFSIQYQNANNSVRVTDEFMQAVEDDEDWHLIARTTGERVKTVKARELMRQIAEAAWRCADPGVQYDTTINNWHTCP